VSTNGRALAAFRHHVTDLWRRTLRRHSRKDRCCGHAPIRRRDIETMAELAKVRLPLNWKPERGAANSYERTREQARVQFQGRTTGKPVYETLSLVPGFGLTSLPLPSAGDIFLDLEGDPFAGERGLEYLFGYVFKGAEGALEYKADWSLSREDEKRAFETFVDFVSARWSEYSDLHIYHYAPYEPSALKRLMGRYATRQEEIDHMLRSSLFVDLYGVIRHSIRASAESYSIKSLEVFYSFERTTRLHDANVAPANVHACLELEDLHGNHGGVEEVSSRATTMMISSRRAGCEIGLSRSDARS
jgi:predicted RecB family nuclease